MHLTCLQWQSSYAELLVKDGMVSKHHRNIQTLGTEMFKVKNELSPGIICDIFIQRINNHYNLRNINFYLKHKKYLFETPFVRTIYKRTESVSCLGPKILGHCSRRIRDIE